MGTTLENGVYLPSEGERNCYAGLKTNWEILDQKVADVTALQQAVAGALHREIVESLPTTDIDPNTIYMVLSGTSATENVYNEFMYVNNAWELIGTSATDLTNYYTKGDVDGLLILKANASDLTSHTGDTTIHVTTADKTKWNNGVSQAYVFRYSSTALVASSTNSNTLLDNTDNLKVGDKVIDSSGVLFSITAIDTANSTFTIGSALIDLALDANVVHTSGNETVGGQKTFTNSIILQNSDTSGLARDYLSKSQVAVLGDAVSGDNTKYRFVDKNNNEICYIRQRKLTNSNTDMSFGVNNIDNDNNSISAEINFVIDRNNDPRISPTVTDSISLGRPTFRWKSIYSNSYYYGNVEFSTKFVTTDTAQTISGAKTFSEDVVIGNSDTTQSSKRLVLRSYKASLSGSNSDNWGINFNAGASYAVAINAHKSTDGAQGLTYTVRTQDSNNNIFTSSYRFRVFIDGNSVLEPDVDNNVSLGRSTNKWKDVQTNLINGLTPSSLSLPDIDNRIDISSYVSDLTGVPNEYTPTVNGWICIRSANATKMSVLDSVTNIGNGTTSNTATYLTVMTPVVANRKVIIRAVCTTLSSAYFVPCQGNV